MAPDAGLSTSSNCTIFECSTRSSSTRAIDTLWVFEPLAVNVTAKDANEYSALDSVVSAATTLSVTTVSVSGR